MRANEMKARFLDHLLDRVPTETHAIASEFPFDSGRRKADLLLSGASLHAFEIKSARDRLDSIGDQLSDYLKCFEAVSVVTEPGHLKTLRQQVPRSVGIIEVSEEGAKERRQAKLRSGLPKDAVATLLTRRDLERLHSTLSHNSLGAGKRIQTDQLRARVAEVLTREQLIALARERVYTRINERFRLFLRNRGVVTHAEDLYYLTDAPESLGPY